MKRKVSCGSCRHCRPLADEDDEELESNAGCDMGRIVMSTVDIALKCGHTRASIAYVHRRENIGLL